MGGIHTTPNLTLNTHAQKGKKEEKKKIHLSLSVTSITVCCVFDFNSISNFGYFIRTKNLK
jgi:hypothetical protein